MFTTVRTHVLPEFLSSLEAFIVCDGKHAKESLATSEIVVADRCIVLLASRIKNIYLYLFAIQNDLR